MVMVRVMVRVMVMVVVRVMLEFNGLITSLKVDHVVVRFYYRPGIVKFNS